MNQEMGIIIDSTVLNSYKNGDACARKLILDAVDGDINISVSTVSIMNIWSRDTFDRKSEIGFTGIFSFLKIISLDGDVARYAGGSLREYIETDSLVGVEQAVVAAHAVLMGKDIVTNEPDRYVQFNSNVRFLGNYID